MQEHLGQVAHLHLHGTFTPQPHTSSLCLLCAQVLDPSDPYVPLDAFTVVTTAQGFVEVGLHSTA